jgi:hypothetical protein
MDLLFAEGFQIGEVFLTAERSLVGDILFTSQEKNGNVSIRPVDLPGIGLFPRHAGYRGDKVSADRRHAKLDYMIGLFEIRRREIQKAKAKIFQRRESLTCVSSVA